MRLDRINPTTLIVGAVALVVGYAMLRGIKGFATDVADIAVKSAEGVVIGIGKVVGVPETDAQKCEAAVAAGEWWNASFLCPAGTFFKSAAGAIFDPDTGEVVGYTEPGESEIINIYEPNVMLN